MCVLFKLDHLGLPLFDHLGLPLFITAFNYFVFKMVKLSAKWDLTLFQTAEAIMSAGDTTLN